jgi:hypothetical protein
MQSVLMLPCAKPLSENLNSHVPADKARKGDDDQIKQQYHWVCQEIVQDSSHHYPQCHIQAITP